MEKKIKVQELLGSITKNLECSICLDLLNNPVSTKCDHPFCRFCILEFLEKKRSVPCPLCKAPITKRSLNERPLLNNMVEGVRNMISSFQEDTGAIFSPPRGPPVINLTPCTPEALPSKSARGTKRKIISESPKKTNSKTNCRQSKRRKSLQDTVEESENVLPHTISTPGTDNQTALLQYLDQGSCGGNDNSDVSSYQNQEITTTNFRNKHKSESRGNISKHGLNCDMKVDPNVLESYTTCTSVTKDKCVDRKKSSIFDLTAKEKIGQKFYSLRDHKKVEYNFESPQSCSESPGKKDLYNFNDSPVTPVHMLRHQRKNSVKDKNDTTELSVLSITTENQDKFSDDETRGTDKTSLNMTCDNKSNPNLLKKNHQKQTWKGQDLSVGEKRNITGNMGNLATSDNVRQNRETRQNHKVDDVECSPDFELKEKALFEVNCKTYTRQKNKHSHIKLYNKVNSWLKENEVNQNDGCHDNLQEEEQCVKGDNSTIDISQTVLNTNENAIHLDNESESSQQDGKCETKDESEVDKNVEIENKENDKLMLPETKSLMSQNSVVQKILTKTIVVDIANSKDDQLQPIVAQKRRIFRTKPKVQTTSVCQKKGVLIIKKVSPGGNTEEEHMEKDENKVTGQENDPFEFKSSQKTPVIPDKKKSKTFKKGQKDKLRGKLDLRFGNTGKNGRFSEVIEISDEGSDAKKEKVTEKDDGKTKIACTFNRMENIDSVAHVHPVCRDFNSSNSGENLKKCDKTMAKTVSPQISGSVNSQASVIPGSIDESVVIIGKQNKKLSKLSNKLKKKRSEEIDKEKNMEKMIEKINSAEDFDLLTCTQEVIEEMEKNTASSDVIPDTADLPKIPKRKKSVSFASNNVEISSTPRQTRRSVPMLEDRNHGRMIPKETKQGSKMADTSSGSVCTNRKSNEKPFVWEEDNDSNCSSNTDDLDIHPSQEEFETPSEDVTLTNHTDNSLTSLSQNDDEIKLSQSCAKNESHMFQNVQPQEQRKHPKEAKDAERQLTEMSQLHESLTQADDEKGSSGYSDDTKVYVDNTQEDMGSCEQDLEEGENMEVQVVPESVDDILVDDTSKENQESVDVMFSKVNTSNENQEGVDVMLSKDNTRKGNRESVDAMFADDNTNKLNCESIGDKLIKKSNSNVNEIQEVLTHKNKDNSFLRQGQKVVPSKIEEKEIIQNDILPKSKTCNEHLNVKEVHSESQSTVSTINSSLDSNNSLRKSRNKLRARKFKSPERVETPSVVEETPLIVGKDSEEKNIEIVSDTCSASQESVSILIPVENLSMNKGERLNERKSDENGKNPIGKMREESFSDLTAKTEIELESLDENLSNKTKMVSCNDKKYDGSCKATLTNSISKFNNIDRNWTPELESNIGGKCHEKERSNNYGKNLKKTHEICCDSDVVYVSQSNFDDKRIETIILSGSESDQKETTQNVVGDTANSSEMETVPETMETDDNRTEEENREAVICSQKSTDTGLTPTLVSQNTLNLRNSAEKKRRSAERQLHNGKAKQNNGPEILVEKQKLKNSTCSPEDIFQMDSELLSSGSQSIPQNQEGIIGFDLESQEITDTLRPSEFVSQKTFKPSEVVSQKTFKPSEVASQKTFKPCEVASQKTFKPSEVASQNMFERLGVASQKTLRPSEPVGAKVNTCMDDVAMENEDNLHSKLSENRISCLNHADSPKKVQQHLKMGQAPDSDVDSSQEKQVKRKSTGKRTIRGLARKKQNHNSQNSISTEDSCLSEAHEADETENTENRIVSPCKSTVYNRKEVRSPYNSAPKTNIDVTPRKSQERMEKKTHPGSKISPTFAYSPQKPKKARQTKLKTEKSANRSILKTDSSFQKSDNIDTSCQEDSDSDVVMATENKFEKLLKDNIADTEVSDDERETIREDTLNFSVDLTLMEGIDDENNKVLCNDYKDKKKNNFISNEQNNTTKSWPDDDNYQEGKLSRSVLVPENENNASDSSTILKSKSTRNKIEKKMSPKHHISQESLKVIENQEESDHGFDIDMEPSSSLPDIIGDGANFNQENIPSESEDEDDVLIKFGQDVYDSDGEEKRLEDLNRCNKPVCPNDSQNLNGTVTTMDEVQDCDQVQELDDKVQDLDENSDDVVTVKKKRRRIIEDDSDSSDGSEDSSSGRHLDNTSSSAFSSQSEPVDTQQKNKLESEIERMRREMKELQAQLAVRTENNSSVSQKRKTKDSEKGPITVLDLSDTDEQEKRPDSPNSEDIHEYHSDEELFLSPRTPSPPPLSPQRIDLSNDGNDFMTEFRKQNLELSPLHSSPCEKNKEIVKHEEVIHKELSKEPQKNDKQLSSRTELVQSQDELIELCQPKSRMQHREPHTKENKPTLVYSPVIKGDNSPQISPVMSKKGNHVLSPLVSNKVATQKSQKCFVSTGLVVPQMKELQKLAVLNQCKFITKFTTEVTHVIVKTDPIGSGICDRTLKFFQGISHKCWILDYKWVIDSRAAGHLLPEGEYEIKGDTVTDEFHYGPRRARLSKPVPLFNNIQFLVLGNSKGLQVDDLKSLLKACGGCVMFKVQDITDTGDAVVVTCSDYDDDSEQEDQPAPDELRKFKEFYDERGILSLSREWVLDSLTVYKLQPLTDYILTPGNVKESSIPLFDKR